MKLETLNNNQKTETLKILQARARIDWDYNFAICVSLSLENITLVYVNK
jgi:hypothetical protein